MSAVFSLNSASRNGGNASATPLWVKLVQDAVASSDFGTVQIKVHAGEVVQIESTRKIRVPSSPARNPLHPTAPAEE